MAPLAASLIAPMGSSLIHPVASSMTNAISEKGVTRAEKKKEGGIFPLLALPLMMKFLGQWVTWAKKESEGLEKDTITWVIWIKLFWSAPCFKQYQGY